MPQSIILKSFVLLTGLILTSNSIAEMNRDQKKLISDLEKVRLKQNVPGFAFVVVDKNATLLSAASGVEDRVTKKPMSVDSLIRIGSITKSFTALAILTLQQSNKLLLTDDVKQYTNDLPLVNRWQKNNPVTIVQLLEHTSGLLDLSKAEFSFNDGTIKSLKRAFAVAPEQRETKWPPGKHASYSNVGAGYLGYIIEKVSATSYESYVTKALLKPLKMTNSRFFLDATTAKNLVTGYDADGETVIPYWHMIFRPFGALNSSAKQMAAFVQLYLNDGNTDGIQLISKKNIRRMEIPTSTLAAKTGLKFGYGLANYAHLHNGSVFHGHGGDGDGYLTFYAYNRDTGLGYFIVINAFNKTAIYTMRMLLEDFITKDAGKIQLPLLFSHKTLSQFVGHYEQVTYRMPWLSNSKSTIEISVNNNKLYYQDDSSSQQLIPVTQNHFRLQHETVATSAFIAHSGELYFQNSDANYKRVKK